MTETQEQFLIQDGQSVVFFGDSITDCGRRTEEHAPLGKGFVRAVIGLITAKYPKRNITYYNRGFGGNVCRQLLDRCDEDVIAFKPDWVTVLIGINDLHCRYKDDLENLAPEGFAQTYDKLLGNIAQETGARLVLLDPFYIKIDPQAGTEEAQVMAVIGEYISVVDDMCVKYGAIHVKLHDIFQFHLSARPAEVFCPEPVHPNMTGHMIIAESLLKSLGW